MRVLSLYLPAWSIDRVRRHARRRPGPGDGGPGGGPILLVRQVAMREQVVAACAAAETAGVRGGMTLTEARAVMGPGPVMVQRSDVAGDRCALERLAVWATRFAPRVEPERALPGAVGTVAAGLRADITGCQRLYRGERNLLRELAAAVRGLGFRCQVASAPSFACAMAVARFGGRDLAVVEADEVPEVLADLPVAGLGVDAEVVGALAEIGVDTIGQVMDLPRRSLPSRYGPALLLRMDQAMGRAIETISPVRPRPPLVVQRLFDGPVRQVVAVQRVVRELVAVVCDRLLAGERGAGRLVVVLGRSDCGPYRFEVSVSRPSRDAMHLWALVAPRLERAHLGFGVEAVTVTADRVTRLPHRQQAQPGVGDEGRAGGLEREVGQVIDGLVGRLGSAAVCRGVPGASHLPERARCFQPADQPVPDPLPVVTGDPRPSALLAEPRPVQVMAVTPDGPLVQMSWEGEGLRVLATIGPQRIAGPWWRADRLTAVTRDYFRVQDQHGRWWWVFRELETHRWFVHGRWV